VLTVGRLFTFVAFSVGAKFTDRESHRAEDAAGIVFFRANAFLVGNTVFRCVNKILSGSYYSDYGKYTKRYCKESSVGVTKISVHSVGDILRNVSAAATTATAAVICLSYLSIQNYRVYDLYNCPLIGML
jgi:hypothetical protein